MRSPAPSARMALALGACLVSALAFGGGAVAKGTPSNVTVTCGAGVSSATVTVQLTSGAASPTPASTQLVLACSAAAPVASAKIAPFSQPAGAYAWSAFVTATTSTFGCGGTTTRGTTATCTNAAGGVGEVTVRAT